MSVLISSTKPVGTDRDFFVQFNSLRSACLSDFRLVINYSDDKGFEKLCKSTTAVCIDKVDKGDNNLPIMNSIFKCAAAQALDSQESIVFINGDIVVGEGFSKIERELNSRFGSKWMAICRRREVSLNRQLTDGEIVEVANDIIEPPSGRSTAIDFFALPSGSYKNISIPEGFTIGRPGWDNWFVARARAKGFKVIEISNVYAIRHISHPEFHEKGTWDIQSKNFFKYGINAFCDLRDANFQMHYNSNAIIKIKRNYFGWFRGSYIGRWLVGFLRTGYSFVFRR